jgi:NADH-quinone oxidoreductase subunit J
MTYPLYIASAMGAMALVLMMPRRSASKVWPVIGAIIGGAVLGSFWLYLSRQMTLNWGIGRAAMGYYYVFSFIAIASAARVITHTKPVFAALWFVMVVLASAGLFLVLDAEFMAAAMVIIYGGAILVTYVFVIMLAAESGDPEVADDAPEYERIAREPVAAVIMGFFLLAALLSVLLMPMQRNQAMQDEPDSQVIEYELSNRPAKQLIDQLAQDGQVPSAQMQIDAQTLDNVERVGRDLFNSHPLGLELAGVILLISLVGAVVIARKHVEQPSTTD